jgi:hypothetical protein
LRTKTSCGITIADFHFCGLSKFNFCNSPQSPVNSATFWYLFLNSGWFKNQPKIFLELSISLEPKNLPYRDSCTSFFTSDFFQEPQSDSTAKNMPKIADLKLQTSEKIAIAELRSNISLKSCGSASFKLRNCDCGLEKKLRVPTSDGR